MFRTFSREKFVLSAIFLVSLAMQLWLWLGHFPYTDNNIWVPGAQDFADGVLPGYSTTIPQHPGTAILLPVAALIRLGIPAYDAMQITMAFLMSICVVIMAYLCRVLRPQSLWWLGVCALFIPNPIYMEMSAVSALAAVLACIYILLMLYIREKGASRESLALLGVCGGVLLATRADVGVSIMLFSLPFLWPLARIGLIRTGVIALLYFGALNPFIWAAPTTYIVSFVRQVGENAVTSNVFDYPLSIITGAVVAFALGFIGTYIRPNFLSLPKDYLKWFLATSVLLCGLLLISQYHPTRYFFPLIAMWEMFLPLFLLELLGYFAAWKIFRPLRRSEYALILLLLFFRVWTIYMMWLHIFGPLFHIVV
jgi:hypothetical protein